MNSAPSSRPPVQGGIDSPPGKALTDCAHGAVHVDGQAHGAEFRAPLTSSALVMGFEPAERLVGMGPYTSARSRSRPWPLWISVSSSFAAAIFRASQRHVGVHAERGPEPHSATAAFLPYQYATTPWLPSSVPADTASSRSKSLDHRAGRQHLDLSWPSAMSLTLRA